MVIDCMVDSVRRVGRNVWRHSLLLAAVAASGCLDHTPTLPEQNSLDLASAAAQSGPSQTVERGNPNGTPLGASVDSIVTYWNSGARKHAVSSSAPRALGTGGAGLPRESMAAMKGNLEKVSWRFKGGRTDVTLMMRLADALTASTREEYRRHLAALPVTMRTAPVMGHNGIDGFRRDVYVYGARKLSVYFSGGSGHAGRSHSGAIGVASLPSGEMCQDEINGEIIVDECATDDDLIEAELILAALDYEVEALRSQMNAAVGTYYDFALDPELCDCVEPYSFITDVSFLKAGRDADAGFGAPMLGEDGCAGDGVAAAIAIGTWLLHLDQMIGIRGSKLTKRFQAHSVFGAVAAAAAVGGGIGTFLECLE